eukprot:scaffold328946_cov66-Tisochrysis_lutea.AAC.1
MVRTLLSDIHRRGPNSSGWHQGRQSSRAEWWLPSRVWAWPVGAFAGRARRGVALGQGLVDKPRGHVWRNWAATLLQVDSPSSLSESMELVRLWEGAHYAGVGRVWTWRQKCSLAGGQGRLEVVENTLVKT